MASASTYMVYQHLDDPELIALWTIDEFLVLVVPFLFGLLFRQPLIGAVISYACYWGLKRLKAGKTLSWAYGLLHWYLSPVVSLSKGVPPSNFKVMVG